MISTMASIGLTTIGRQFVIHFSCAETVDHHSRIICRPAIKNDSSAILSAGRVSKISLQDERLVHIPSQNNIAITAHKIQTTTRIRTLPSDHVWSIDEVISFL